MGVAQTYLQIAKITKDMAISVRNLDNSNSKMNMNNLLFISYYNH
jgi:hypothetical protein